MPLVCSHEMSTQYQESFFSVIRFLLWISFFTKKLMAVHPRLLSAP